MCAFKDGWTISATASVESRFRCPIATTSPLFLSLSNKYGRAHPQTLFIEELEQEWKGMLLVGGDQMEGRWSYEGKQTQDVGSFQPILSQIIVSFYSTTFLYKCTRPLPRHLQSITPPSPGKCIQRCSSSMNARMYYGGRSECIIYMCKEHPKHSL